MITQEDFQEHPNLPIDCDAPNNQKASSLKLIKNLKYILPGIIFGIVLVKGEIISWYRIQEMFRFQSFHMYGVIGSAILTGLISVQLIKKLKIKSIQGEPIKFLQRTFQWGNVLGGFIFGLGWALTGACPGPIYAQIGSGTWTVVITLLSALTGTWVYGLLRPRLPH